MGHSGGGERGFHKEGDDETEGGKRNAVWGTGQTILKAVKKRYGENKITVNRQGSQGGES